MNEISKERLKEILSDETYVMVMSSEVMDMARELLALRERAEPGNYRVVHLDALGAACGALQRYAPASETLALLRRYTFGDLSAITLTPVVPDGWVAVPVEPTIEMQIAFAEAWFSKVRCVDDYELEDAYAAMLAAVPGKEG
ncbi:hypothetical protein ACP26C_13785 [Franconibacter helveticus 513]|uniref:hypothetical protein n=1 Tax=Franconibacter helveticus TaxID=357240 RepID=UPI0003FD3B79|nr:hypothetical protein [Franconibacter helveticus]